MLASTMSPRRRANSALGLDVIFEDEEAQQQLKQQYEEVGEQDIELLFEDEEIIYEEEEIVFEESDDDDDYYEEEVIFEEDETEELEIVVEEEIIEGDSSDQYEDAPQPQSVATQYALTPSPLGHGEPPSPPQPPPPLPPPPISAAGIDSSPSAYAVDTDEKNRGNNGFANRVAKRFQNLFLHRSPIFSSKSRTTTAAAIKIQAFVRSCLTRQRVCKMVEKLIEDLKRQLAVIKIQSFVRSGLTRIRVCKMLDEMIADLRKQIAEQQRQLRQDQQLPGFKTKSSLYTSLFTSPTRSWRQKKRKFDIMKETLEQNLEFKPPLTLSQVASVNPLQVQEQMLLKGGMTSARELAISRWKLVKLAMKFVTNLKEATEHRISIGEVKPEVKVMILQGQMEINRGIPTTEHKHKFQPLMEQAAIIGKHKRLREKVLETTAVEDDSESGYDDDENNNEGYDLNDANTPSPALKAPRIPKPPRATTMSPRWTRKQKVSLPKITNNRSKEQHVLLEAIAMGRIRRLKPQITTNYDANGDEEEEEKKKDILDWWDPDKEVHYESLEDVPLPTDELPKTPFMKLSKTTANSATSNKMQEAHVRRTHSIFDDVGGSRSGSSNDKGNVTAVNIVNGKNKKSSLASLGVAEAACERERRLFPSSTHDNHTNSTANAEVIIDNTKLRMTQKCSCKYCKTSNPYQTNAYRKLWLKQRGLLMPGKMNLAALSNKFEKNKER